MGHLARLARFFVGILFPERLSESLVADAEIDTVLSLSKPRIERLLEHNVHVLLPYQHSLVKACIREAKFHAGEKARTHLSHVLREFLEASTEELTSVSHERVVVVPIPLSKTRLNERGYNQIEEIAKIALQGLENISLDTALLEKTKDTPAQAKLARAYRLTNVVDAFKASTTLHNHTLYIILDDVATTGATLTEAKRALSCALPPSSSILLLALSH